MRRIIIMLLFYLLPISLLASADSFINKIDSIVYQEMQYWKVPGCAIVIVKDDKPLFIKGYGLKKIGINEKVNEKTVFSIASSTKQFTALLALILQAEGHYSLDDPVKNIIKDFKLKDLYIESNLTLRDLLLQRSGFSRYSVFWDNVPNTRKETVERMMNLETSKKFRDIFEYSNINYLLAGYAMEQSTGKSWENLVKEKIFAPLHMTSSFFSLNDLRNYSNFAYPHIEFDDIKTIDFRCSDILGPAGGIRTSAEDLSKWLIINLNNGLYNGKQIIPSSFFAEIRKQQMITNFPPLSPEASFNSYCLGLFHTNYRGKDLYHHGGVYFGFSSMVSFMPKEKIGLAILTNLNGTPLTYILQNYLYDTLLDFDEINHSQPYRHKYLQTKNFIKKYDDAIDRNKIINTKLTHHVSDFEGYYTCPSFGTIQIVTEADSLKVVFSKVECPLSHYHYDNFKMINPNDRMEYIFKFYTGERGDIEGFFVSFEDNVESSLFKRTIDPKLFTEEYLINLSGKYKSENYEVEVFYNSKEKRLFIKSNRIPEIALKPYKEDYFDIDSNSPYLKGLSIEFVKDSQNKTIQAKLINPFEIETADRIN